MDKIKIKAEERAEQGSAAVRRLRRAGKIPAAVMRMNKGGTLLVKLDAHEFMLGLRGHTSKQLLVTLDMDGKEMPALMREMQNDVVKGTPIHVDFSEVSLTQKVRVVVPISLTGEAVGVKIGGGVLEQVLRQLGDKFTLVTRGEYAVAVVKAPEGVDTAKPGAAPAAEANPEVIKKGKEEAAGEKKEEKK